MTDLTYNQQYRIPLEVAFEDDDDPVKVTYAGCGSHSIRVNGPIRLAEARRLRDHLNTLPGIDSEEALR